MILLTFQYHCLDMVKSKVHCLGTTHSDDNMTFNWSFSFCKSKETTVLKDGDTLRRTFMVHYIKVLRSSENLNILASNMT